LKKTTHNLSEVTVTASKVKFYHKGDTIVYNADAFILSEGSMLDALIRQLPGVELRSDGRIYLNGRFVDNLVLNGKDFFKGDNNVMLENIGAYTVKDIQVYERLNAVDSYIGQALTGDKELVMDVRLKKDYMDSWLGNVTMGVGTSDRYLGRGYVARLTPRSRIALFCNLNNVNESRKPGENIADWSPSKMSTGTLNTQSGGMDYFYDLPDNIWKLSGDLLFNRTKSDDGTSVAQTNFTQPAFTYDYSHHTSTQKNWEVKTHHDLRREQGNTLWYLTPAVDYKRWDALTATTAASFDAEQADWSQAFLRSIYENTLRDSALVNRKLADESASGHQLHYDVRTGLGYKIPKRLDVFFLEGTLSGRHNREVTEEEYLLNFARAPERDERSQRRLDHFPNQRVEATAQASYQHAFTAKVALTCAYLLEHTTEKATSLLYALSQSWDDETRLDSYFEVGDKALDVDNSYRLSRSTNRHTFSPTLSASIGDWSFQLSFPLLLSDDRLIYHRVGKDIRKHRTALLFEQKRNSFVEYKHREHTWFASLTYTTKAPDLLAMIDITDTSNPLVITQGNPDLKNSGLLHANTSYSWTRTRCYVSCSMDYQSLSRAFAKGYSYDYGTGVKSYKTYNVDGNRVVSGDSYLSWEFGPMQRFSLKNRLVGTWRQSVDLLGVDGCCERSEVYSGTLTENFLLGVTARGQRLSLVGNVDYSRYSGEAETFAAFRALEFHYGVQGVFKLPFGLGLNTDFTVYSRRGYQDAALNTDHYVWNARATYSLLKGDLLLTLDGFDMLHDLSNVFYTVNAQGRTETINKVLPQYFMLGAQWKFNSKKNSSK
jgi:hypothetical protein